MIRVATAGADSSTPPWTCSSRPTWRRTRPDPRREAVKRADDLRAEQKTASQAVRGASPEERPAVLERAKALAAQVKDAEDAQRAADAALRAAHLPIANVVHDGVPPGGEDDA